MPSRVPIVPAFTAAVAGVLLAAAGPQPLRAQQAPPAVVHAINWQASRDAVEAALREAPIERFEDIPVGVTKPKRAFFKAGAPVRSVAWKPLRPGIYAGYWESYKSEIAAYELDKFLGLDMVPPAVERRIDHELGAVILWVDGVRTWDPSKPLDPPDANAWNLQVVRMKMFDQLIGNIDRNKGNLLYDSDYHLILIDHSRAFTGTTDMARIAQPGRIDAILWDKLNRLTLPDLQAALGKWIGRREMEAVLKRRDRMAQQIDRMVKERGEANVFIR